MLNIAPVEKEQTDGVTRATLHAVETKLGTLPNIFTTLANSPVALTSYLNQAEMLGKGRLSNKQREMIAIAIAQENSCEYCLSAHVVMGKGAGLTDSDIERAREGMAVDPLDEAIISFAKQVVQTRADVSVSSIDAARQAGLDNGLMVEIIANISINILTNYLNRIAGTEVDFPVMKLSAA